MYSTGESFEYQYDAVGNRTAFTQTTALAGTTVTTYTYDAANRLTKVGDVVYSWDARGNLTSDGTFTHTYNSAGRMVRAQSITATLVYTYNADGLRVAQSVGVEQSVFAWDWASGIPEMLSDGDDLYLVGHETLGWWDGADWTYYLPDALGSIRQTVNGAGAVVSSREWTPYGVEVGAAHDGPGYTGEWWDASVGLLYLRARWLDVATGRFTQRDPWPGSIRQPQTRNGWSYASGDPVNLTDASGLRPAGPHEIGDIRDEIDKLVSRGELGAGCRYQYSCNCGWIDWSHALSGMHGGTSLAHTIFSRLEATVDWSPYHLWTGNRGVRVQSWGGAPIVGTVSIVDDIAVVPEGNLQQWPRDWRVLVAAGIFMEHSERVEAAHGFHVGAGASYFSEEDLPSNLIGFYMATQMLHHDPPATYQEALEDILRRCDVLNRQESLAVYEKEYQNGAGFVTGWHSWRARLHPLTQTCVRCTFGYRAWPSAFSNLASLAIHSERNGMWWWWQNSMTDGQPQETDAEGVFALEKYVDIYPLP